MKKEDIIVTIIWLILVFLIFYGKIREMMDSRQKRIDISEEVDINAP